MDKNNKVFVYGTLKTGFSNHHVIEEVRGKFIGEASTERGFTMYDLGPFPAVFPNGDHSITGEVYEIEDMKPLDRLEGYPNFYDRIEIDTIFGKAWLYVLDPVREHPIVETGIWSQKRLPY